MVFMIAYILRSSYAHLALVRFEHCVSWIIYDHLIIHIHIHIYIYRERDRETERETERDRETERQRERLILKIRFRSTIGNRLFVLNVKAYVIWVI